MENIHDLITKMRKTSKTKKLSNEVIIGQVEASLITDEGNVYTGTSINTACNLGHCAEVSAISAMITAGESKVSAMASISADGKILPPCGRCRELIFQINNRNLETDIAIEEGKTMKLKQLLPSRWQDIWNG